MEIETGKKWNGGRKEEKGIRFSTILNEIKIIK